MKILESQIPAERFAALLLEAAKSSFIPADELKGLCLDGIIKLINSFRQKRLLTALECQRIDAVKTALHPLLGEAPSLEDLMTQIDILRALADGEILDRVIVEGPMPMALRRGETVLWIFNGAKAVRHDPNQMSQTTSSPQIQVPVANGAYFGLHVFAEEFASSVDQKSTNGDLVLTNYNIYFLPSADRVMRTPIARLSLLQPYANGVGIQSNERYVTYILGDSWFLANAIARLTQLVRRGARNVNPGLTSLDAE